MSVGLNNHINRIHERVLKIVCQDHNSTFDELLAEDGFFIIHDRNLQKLLIEIFEVKMKLTPKLMNEIFDIVEWPYPLTNELRYYSQSIFTVSKGFKQPLFYWFQDIELYAQSTKGEDVTK